MKGYFGYIWLLTWNNFQDGFILKHLTATFHPTKYSRATYTNLFATSVCLGDDQDDQNWYTFSQYHLQAPLICGICCSMFNCSLKFSQSHVLQTPVINSPGLIISKSKGWLEGITYSGPRNIFKRCFPAWTSWRMLIHIHVLSCPEWLVCWYPWSLPVQGNCNRNQIFQTGML